MITAGSCKPSQYPVWDNGQSVVGGFYAAVPYPMHWQMVAYSLESLFYRLERGSLLKSVVACVEICFPDFEARTNNEKVLGAPLSYSVT